MTTVRESRRLDAAAPTRTNDFSVVSLDIALAWHKNRSNSNGAWPQIRRLSKWLMMPC
jgi:hypothetical protein